MKRQPLLLEIETFLTRHLPHERNLSRATILSYRDAFKLFLRFSTQKNNKLKFDIALFNYDTVMKFLNEIEKTRNIIDACVVQANAQLAIGTTVICKLTDINSNVVAEGIVTINPTLATRALLTVPITQFVNGNAMDIDVTNIHDVQLVIIGPSALVTVP